MVGITKILIVDDSAVARKILRSCIPKGKIFEFHEAEDGLAGVQKFQEVRPDLTFLDLTMPVMDGLSALAKIKEIDGDALVVVSSADVQKKTVQKAMELGAFRVLNKPPNKESIGQTLVAAQKWLTGLDARSGS
jgi:two-component system, chemotaxis family, chemotaxis protein CheY